MHPADKIEKWGIEKLIPYARNSRTHSSEQVGQIAASIKEWGFTNPILVDEDGGILAGHGRTLAAQKLGLTEVPVVVAKGWSDAKKRAYVIADNKLALNAGWDNKMLALELGEIGELGFDLDLTGFTADEVAALTPEQIEPSLTDEDEVPEVPVQPVTVEGDIWLLGKHRVMCGDSTSIDTVEKLMAGKRAQLLHADPPYGMGKESDGVANDNIYGDNLDKFQMEWWATFRTFLEDNASAYIWGNATDLWRLWYRGGLSDSEQLTIRNQIIWDKKHCQGMSSDAHRMYPTATEHCLFFMLGEQGFNNNADNYFNGWEPVRAYLDSERQKMGWNIKDTKRIAGHSENSGCHWFDKSQWSMPTEVVYNAWKAAAGGKAFKRDFEEIKREFEEIKREFYATRAHFDNGHDAMRDVWEFKRVTGGDRHGHATPKPVEMMERVMKSSLPKGSLCVEPFGGSGSTLMGAEKTGRVCFAMELQPKYVDVIVKRWQDFTGKQATHEATGKTFEEMQNEANKP
jgi:DNA modification methylase